MFNFAYQLTKLNRLEVVLKTVERCNINCSYCYFFNDKDKSFLKHPKYISLKMIEDICDFLCTGTEELNIENLVIIFHGGEPLLQKKKDFDIMCNIFRDKLEEKTKLSLSIQTNATLIDDDWIELFQTHEVAVGVSIDGPKIYNDQYRIDHRGKGTYDRLKIGIDKLFDACKKNKIKEPAALSVINPKFSAALIYEHLVYDLGFKVLDFLLPDLSYQTVSKIESEKINSFLLNLIDAWKKHDDPNIHIRILDSIVKKLLASLNPKLTVPYPNQIISISTNGHVVPNDILRNTQFWNDNDEVSITENSLFNIVNSDLFTFLRKSEATIPKNCTDCCWSDLCRGGELINRYNIENNFNNPSIYCSALRELYSTITNHLLSTGVSSEVIYNSLNLN